MDWRNHIRFFYILLPCIIGINSQNSEEKINSFLNKKKISPGKCFLVKNTSSFFIKWSAGLQHLDQEELNFDSDNESGESNRKIEQLLLQ